MRSAGRSATPLVADSGVITDHPSKPSPYLTDGVNLYRYVGTFPSPMGDIIGLENCRSLEVTLWPIGDLRGQQLRTITPAAGP